MNELGGWKYGCFQKYWENPQNGWCIMEDPIKIHDLGYPYFWKHPYNKYVFLCSVLTLSTANMHNFCEHFAALQGCKPALLFIHVYF